MDRPFPSTLPPFTRRRVLGTARIAAAATPVALIGACGTGASKAPTAAEATGKVVWSTRVNADENLWQQQAVVPKVKEKLPKVELTFDTAPSAEWAVKLIASYAAGTPPDIHHGFAGIVISLYAQGQALELTPFIK